MVTRLRALTFFMIWATAIHFAHALEPVFSDRSGNAIRGYDPVSYFTAGEPVKGDDKISHQWNGATWHFASEENRLAFIETPEKYAPQYGGYCAWAVSNGYTASTDPQAWHITEGRLFLNYNKSVRKKWLVEKKVNIDKADNNWPDLQ